VYGANYTNSSTPLIDINVKTGVPVVMYAGKDDNLAVIEDVRWVRDHTPDLIYYKELDDFTHFNFNGFNASQKH